MGVGLIGWGGRAGVAANLSVSYSSDPIHVARGYAQVPAQDHEKIVCPVLRPGPRPALQRPQARPAIRALKPDRLRPGG